MGGVCPFSRVTPVLGGLAHKQAHPLGTYSEPIYRPTVVLAGREGLAMSKVPRYPPRPEHAATVPCGYTWNGSNAITSR